MNKFVNEAIKIDLHIHSKASTHKEDVNIIGDSKIENKIFLCVITDHNRLTMIHIK